MLINPLVLQGFGLMCEPQRLDSERNLPKKMSPALAQTKRDVFLATPEMDIPNIEVVTLSGKRLSLKEDLQEAVRFL